MSIFSRLFKVGQAGANKVLDKLESPELMLDQAIRDKENQVREAKQSVSKCIATERQTKALLQKERDAAAEWELKAEAALRADNEDLAAKALQVVDPADFGELIGRCDLHDSQRSAVDDVKESAVGLYDVGLVHALFLNRRLREVGI